MVQISITLIDMEGWLWVAYILCAIIGGLASSLVSNKGMLIRPCWNDDKKTAYRVGPVTDIVAGIAAAIGILWIMIPQTVFQLIGIGTISGYGGSSILQALLNRLAADITEKEKGKIEAEKSVIEEEKKKIEDERNHAINDKEEVKRNMETELTQANISAKVLDRYMEYIKEEGWNKFKREHRLPEEVSSPWIMREEDLTDEQRVFLEKFEEEWGMQVEEDQTGEVVDVGFTPPQNKSGKEK